MKRMIRPLALLTSVVVVLATLWACGALCPSCSAAKAGATSKCEMKCASEGKNTNTAGDGGCVKDENGCATAAISKCQCDEDPIVDVIHETFSNF